MKVTRHIDAVESVTTPIRPASTLASPFQINTCNPFFGAAFPFSFVHVSRSIAFAIHSCSLAPLVFIIGFVSSVVGTPHRPNLRRSLTVGVVSAGSLVLSSCHARLRRVLVVVAWVSSMSFVVRGNVFDVRIELIQFESN